MSSKIYSVDHDSFVSKISSQYSDVIGRKLGGSIVSVSDEWFAPADNLITAGVPIRQPGKFTSAGAWYDGWETRRHNTEEADWVIIKFGVASAKIIATEIDTAFFNGNHAPAITVEATYVAPDSYKTPQAEQEFLEKEAKWEEIVTKTECGPSQRHFFIRETGLTDKVYTHARLKQYPDGGITRFRLYGKPTAVLPSSPDQEIDLAHVANGGVAISFSDQHFGQVDNLLIPGRGTNMGDGWETKRSRESGHVDWVIVRLGIPGYVDRAVIDTAHFLGNFPQSITIEALDNSTQPDTQVTLSDSRWKSIVPQTKTGPNKIHQYVRKGESAPVASDAESGAEKADFQILQSEKDQLVTHVKLTIIPDGGVKRLRIYGRAKF